MKNFLCFIALLTFITVSTNTFAQKATIIEATEKIKTYPFSDPDPVPILLKKAAIYPYFSFNKFTNTGKKQSWKVVTLENDYIKVMVLPEVGGKISGAIEKSTQNEFLYYNKVIKFRQIAMRGPWTSGGSEFNFGLVGHTPAVATPVDYHVQENPDGSVSCFVGTMDLTSRTRWSVEINLAKDKAFFETKTLWYNYSPLHQSYYSWSNNAVKAGNDLQYFYPGQSRRPHGYSASMEPWPIDKTGRDLSWYKNNNFGSHKSHFVMGEYENYYGGYWHDSQFGFGHWALYNDMPGKKMWIWALSRQGAIWENLLTDTDGQYSEPQAGRLFSQDDHEFFAPYSGDKWTEVLFPFKEIGGLTAASPYGAMNITKDGNFLLIKLCPLQNIDDELNVTLNNKSLFQQHLSLKPMEVYKKSIPLPSTEGIIKVNLNNKISYSSNPIDNDLKRPFSYRLIDESSAEGLYTAAQKMEKRREYDGALKKYIACLDKDHMHIRAKTRIAELYCRRAEYEKGLEYASLALEADMYDPDANYIYGVISRYLGNLVDAKETLGWAARSMKYRSNGYCQLAEINLLEGNYNLALEYANRSMDYNKYNLKTYEILAIIYRKLEKPDKSLATLDKLFDIDPLNHLIRFEQYLLDPTGDKLANFNSKITTEIRHETYLEMAIYYHKLGLKKEAVLILEQAAGQPLIYMWLAYLTKEVAPEKSDQYLKKTETMSAKLVFPFREETIPVLQWVDKVQPDNWQQKYYLGLILWSKGRNEKAFLLFKSCSDVDFAPYYTVMANMDKNNSLLHLEKALSLDQNEWRNWHHLISYLNGQKKYVRVLELAKTALNKHPEEIYILMDYASSLYNNGQHSKCLTFLNKLEVLPYEGGWEAHDLFKRVQIKLAMSEMEKNKFKDGLKYLNNSKKYPEHLGTGSPYEPDNRLQDYLEFVCYDRMKEAKKAEQAQKRIYDFTIRNWDNGQKHNYFGYLSLKYFKEQDKIKQLNNLWKTNLTNPTHQWYYANVTENRQKSLEIENKLSNDSRFKITLDAVNFINK